MTGASESPEGPFQGVPSLLKPFTVEENASFDQIGIEFDAAVVEEKSELIPVQRGGRLHARRALFDYLARGLLSGRQLIKGQPWQIDLSDDQISRLRARLRHTKRSRKEAS
jgi:hypothetical protein